MVHLSFFRTTRLLAKLALDHVLWNSRAKNSLSLGLLKLFLGNEHNSYFTIQNCHKLLEYLFIMYAIKGLKIKFHAFVTSTFNMIGKCLRQVS